MYPKQIKTLSDRVITLNMPENAMEIPSVNAIAVRAYFEQLTGTGTGQTEAMSPFELLARLTNVPVDELYELLLPEQADEVISWYTTAVMHHISNHNVEQYHPKYVKVRYMKRLVRVSLKNMNIIPAGAYNLVLKIISDEIAYHVVTYGDDWESYFNPSFESMAKVVDQFLYKCVAPGLWSEELSTNTKFSTQLSIAEVMYIARHFFNRYPKLWLDRPSLLERLRQKVINRRWEPVKVSVIT